jgi:carbon-monoxide dehydrogenase medium subunit
VKPAPFEYHAPASAADAAALLADLGETAKVLAGGQSLVPMLALRLAVFDHLVDVSRIPEMRGVERRDGALWIGAATTQAAVGASAAIASAVPLLAKATPLVGHFQIRNRGTLGGSVAHADPAGEYPAVALTLDALMHVVSPRGARAIPAADFFRGLWTTSMDPDEVLVGVSFPIWEGRCGFAIEEVARRDGDFAITGAAVALELDGDDRIRRAAIGLLGLGTTPERAAAAELAVTGRAAAGVEAGEVGTLAMRDLASIPSDLHGSAAYRARAGAVTVARAWAAAVAEAGRG